MTRTAITVGPAVVVGSSGGAISTSITSCEPPNSVRLPRRTDVQLADRPAGTTEYDSVVSPRLCTVSGKVSVSPGSTSTSSWENQACTDTTRTIPVGHATPAGPVAVRARAVRLAGVHDRESPSGDRSSPDAVTQRRLTQRPRRLRRTAAMRDLVAESHLRVDDLIAPLFVREGIDEPQPIVSLPGVVQHTRSSLRTEVAELADLGVRSVILFGVPASKDAVGSGAYDPDGVVQVALRDLRADLGDDIVVMADLCVDEYTDHGHCGIVDEHGVVDNDATLGIYARAAVAQARAGAHVVAPSGMMDGQVAAIRCALDADGHHDVAVLAYAAKYASALYGPFRDAVDVTIVGGGDRKGYQQDWRNAREARREIMLDIAEGADMVMVKPALAYLDVIADAAAHVDVPLAAYHVSGEYAMICAAAERGWIDGDAVALEHLGAIKRAGADIVLTYFTRWFAEGVHDGRIPK